VLREGVDATEQFRRSLLSGAGRTVDGMYDAISRSAVYVLDQGHSRVVRLPANRVAGRGIARTFQHVNVLPNMSVLDNVALGAHLRGRSGTLASLARLDRAEERQP
jgi:branched-chain amino acid transport system permease protein